MRKAIIMLCAVAALAGCSQKGGTGGTDRSTSGTERGSRYDTNTGGGTSPTNNTPNTNRTDQGRGTGYNAPQGSSTQ